jgi:arylsulfatase A-like enzyme
MGAITKSLFILTFIASTLAGCSKKSLSEIDTSKFNLVVILIDTLRADHLPFYGYQKNTAPFLSTIAEKSVVFENAFSTCSYTAPATASIFTSMYPSQHGVITGHFANLKLQKGNQTVKFDKIPEEIMTLGEEISSLGLRSYGVADNLNIAKHTGFAQGFDKFETYQYKTAEVINKTLMSWKDEIESNKRYFTYIHYMDPHAPYHQRAPWYEHSEDSIQAMKNAYDSEISYLDSHIEKMFKEFKWLDNSIVVILADHGEEFKEHGRIGHGKTLYREVIEVPFLIYVPGLKSARIKNYVTTMDLLPTLSGLLRFPAKNSWQGHDLTQIINKNTIPDRTLFSELLRRPDHPHPEVRSALTNDWHYLGITRRGDKTQHELYNTRLDKRETSNLAEEKAAITSDLNKQAFNVGVGKKTFETITVEESLSDEGLNQLKTLGYAE